MAVALSKRLSPKQLEWRNNPSVHAWTRQNGLLSIVDQVKWLEKIENDPTIEMFGIIDPNGLNVGTCGLTSISTIHGTAEFSLFIGPEHQRKGYAKSALIELLLYGFKNLRLHCIWGETFEGNPALKLFEDLGFQREGTLRERYYKNGSYVDSFMVSVLEREARERDWWK